MINPMTNAVITQRALDIGTVKDQIAAGPNGIS
jgi:hypothetical protein